MILVDSSVWIDYFNGKVSRQTDLLDNLLQERILLVGDLILAEVLQGFRRDEDLRTAKKLLSNLEYADMLGRDVALHSVKLYRSLRKKGITVRRTIDSLIAAFCIKGGHTLLHADRDFDLLARHCGLKVF